MVDAQSFRSDGAGKKNPIEKSQDPAEKAGGSQNQSSGDKGPFAWREIHEWDHLEKPLLQFMKRGEESFRKKTGQNLLFLLKLYEYII